MQTMLEYGIFFVIAGSGLWFLGYNLIDAYFRRKERFVDNLQDKLKGDPNAQE